MILRHRKKTLLKSGQIAEGDNVQLFDDIPPAQNEFVKAKKARTKSCSVPRVDSQIPA